MKEFFFRVASLAFETSVLSELEKSGSRQIGDVVREYLSEQSWIKCQSGCTVRHPGYLFFFFFSFYRNQQQLKQSVYIIEEETVKLLSVRMGETVLKFKVQTEMRGFLGGKRRRLLFSADIMRWEAEVSVFLE